MAYILKTDGTRVGGIKGEKPNGKLTLKQMQDAVGGYIEGVPGTDHYAWCNEEGRINGMPFNPVASLAFSQMLFGNVLVLEEGEKDDDE